MINRYTIIDNKKNTRNDYSEFYWNLGIGLIFLLGFGWCLIFLAIFTF